MIEPQAKPVEVGLVLQGGGALGAYEWGAVSALLELMDEAAALGRNIVLKCVTGVSIGAINAACIVGAADRTDGRCRLAALWQDLTLQTPDAWSHLRLDLSAFGLPTFDPARDLSLFGLPGFYEPRGDILNFPRWTSYYDTRALISTLRRHVDFAALNASATRFIVTAVDVASGELTRFSNQPLLCAEPEAKRAGKSHKDKHAEIGPQHVLASGSLPPQFPWTTIDGRRYWDGGIVDNSPLGDAVDAFSAGEGTDRLLVVMNLYPLGGGVPRNLAAVGDRVHELQLGNRLRQDHAMAQRINALVETIKELAAVVPAGAVDPWLRARLDEAERYKVIDAITQIDLQASGAAQDGVDDESGLRDFSAATVQRRRARGYDTARASLVPLFETHGLIEPASLQPLRASA